MSNQSQPMNPFEIRPVGTLMGLQESEETRYEYEIWFDYTRQAMAEIREGKLVAVRNFTIPKRPQRGSAAEHHHYTILEITSLLPIHYAVAGEPRGYPPFEQEARKSAAVDWRTQEDQSTEETTKIRCKAIPTNLELIDPPMKSEGPLQVEEESNIPMLGEEVKLLTPGAMQFVVNCGIEPQKENVISAGPLKVNGEVEVFLRIEDLLRTHFGVFGYTGAGKSNLVSTITRKLLKERTSREEKLKLVVFDLMGEYTALLIDLLVQMQPPQTNALVVCIGDKTLPGSTVEYLAGKRDPRAENKAIQDLLETTYLPKTLRTQKDLFRLPIRRLLQGHKIRVWRGGVPTIGTFVEEIRPEVTKGNMGGSSQVVNGVLDTLAGNNASVGDSVAVQQATSTIGEWLNPNGTKNGEKKQKLSQTAANNLRTLQRRIEEEHKKFASYALLPADASITIPQIIRQLNDPQNSSLIIIQAHNPDELRHFAWMLGTFLFDERRQTGQILPLVSFVFDEADEFIPQTRSGTYGESVEIAMILARRGRKFGLGIGIATQRIVYLDTNIMGQPHTYFVSKLPRKSDRERITEAFGLSEDMFRQTFKFKKGDWLLVSHDAAGLESVPIPIHTENAEERIMKFLQDFNQSLKTKPVEGRLF
jgi:uncharacterized protein